MRALYFIVAFASLRRVPKRRGANVQTEDYEGRDGNRRHLAASKSLTTFNCNCGDTDLAIIWFTPRVNTTRRCLRACESNIHCASFGISLRLHRDMCKLFKKPCEDSCDPPSHRPTKFNNTVYNMVRRDCNHGFHPNEDPVCCDYLADKTTFQPIRIRHFLKLSPNLKPVYKKRLKQVTAIVTTYFKKTLKVRRTKGKLFMKASPAELWSASMWSVHNQEFWELSLVGGLVGRAGFMAELGEVFSCGDMVMPAKTFSKVTLCDFAENPHDSPESCETIPGGSGIAADLVIQFVLRHCDDPSQNANAMACQRDQCGRPTFGLVTICEAWLKKLFSDVWIRMYSPDDIVKYIVQVLIHEVTHVVGFIEDSFQFFRHPDGMAMVPHVDGGAIGEVPYYCEKDGDIVSVAWPSTKQFGWRFVDLTKWGIIKVVSDHGLSATECKCANLTSNTSIDTVRACLEPSFNRSVPHTCAFVIATPSVQAMAREYFGCEALEGMPLETSPILCEVYGSHWARNVITGEVMEAALGIYNDAMSISKITLALLQDSGWYQVDFARTTPMVPGIHWGYRTGCSLFTHKCGENHPSGYFCSSGEEKCSRAGRQKLECMPCTIGEHVLPKQWQYFPDDPKKVCLLPWSELPLCPIFDIIRSEMRGCTSNTSVHCASGLCQKADEHQLPTEARCGPNDVDCVCADSQEADSEVTRFSSDCRVTGDPAGFQYGEFTGVNSYCFMSGWYRKKHISDATGTHPRCYAVICARDGKSYAVYMVREFNGRPIVVGNCTSEMGTIDPRSSLELNDSSNYHMGGLVQCQPPALVCRETNNFLDF